MAEWTDVLIAGLEAAGSIWGQSPDVIYQNPYPWTPPYNVPGSGPSFPRDAPPFGQVVPADWTPVSGGNGGGVQIPSTTNGGGACGTPRPRLPSSVIVNDPCSGNPNLYKRMGVIGPKTLTAGSFRERRNVNDLAKLASTKRYSKKKKR